jgi:hypothetical protein
MITGEKLLALLDNADKTDRDLIRYVCNGLQAYDVNQRKVDTIRDFLRELERLIAAPRLPGANHYYAGVMPSSDLAISYHHDLNILLERGRLTFEAIRDSLWSSDLAALSGVVSRLYYERGEVESHIGKDINPRGYPPNFLAANAEYLARTDPSRLLKIKIPTSS